MCDCVCECVTGFSYVCGVVEPETGSVSRDRQGKMAGSECLLVLIRAGEEAHCVCLVAICDCA